MIPTPAQTDRLEPTRVVVVMGKNLDFARRAGLWPDPAIVRGIGTLDPGIGPPAIDRVPGADAEMAVMQQIGLGPRGVRSGERQHEIRRQPYRRPRPELD